ncbi:MAG TPA: EscU/YscU/HrcU family type III secretion system export apparatus switch protein [Bryobacteraceae bacterium]|jgi:flagellar biosynthetic protein FlhB
MADSSKTEKPTNRRLDKARKEGQFASSRELVAAGQFLVFLALLQAWFPQWLGTMKQVLGQSLVDAFHSQVDLNSLPGIFWTLAQRAVVPLSALAGLTFITTLALHLAITQMGLSLQKLTPDLTRLNPAAKVKQMAHQAPSAVLQALFMLIVFGSAIYLVAKQNAELFLALPFTSLDIGLQKTGAAMKDLLWKGAAVFLVFGLVDLFRQKRRFTKDMRMSKHEIKQENKESETNPHVKGKIRRMRRDLARRRMMTEVRTATALVVNPTHYAVALRYGFDSSATPVVVAKGKNYLALRIREIARESGVPLVENPLLAQALYKSVDVGREIPPHLYRAVAEVLAYIYKLTKARSHRPPKRRL